MKYKTWNYSHNFQGFYWNVLQGNRVYYNDIGYFFATVIYYLSKVNLGVTHGFITNLSRRQRHYCSVLVSRRYLPIVSLYQIKLHWVNKYSLKLTLKRKVFLLLNFVVFIKRKKKIGSNMSSLPESKKLRTGQVYTKVKNLEHRSGLYKTQKGICSSDLHENQKGNNNTEVVPLWGNGRYSSARGYSHFIFDFNQQRKKIKHFLRNSRRWQEGAPCIYRCL